MQGRPARHDNLGKLLTLGQQWRLLVDRVLEVGHVEQGSADQLLVVLQVFGRILDEQAVAGLQHDRRQLGELQRLTALNLVDTHIAVTPCQHLGKGLAVGETALFHVQLGAEDARRRVGHRRHAVRKQARRDQP